jgi:hypothetical protein
MSTTLMEPGISPAYHTAGPTPHRGRAGIRGGRAVGTGRDAALEGMSTRPCNNKTKS